MRHPLKTLTLVVLALQTAELPLRREEGQTLAEYALILALIAVAAFGAIFFLRKQITDLFSSIGSAL